MGWQAKQPPHHKGLTPVSRYQKIRTNVEMGPADWLDIAESIRRLALEPWTVNRLVNLAIRWKPDNGDDWRSPQETIKLGYGDCEDIALV